MSSPSTALDRQRYLSSRSIVGDERLVFLNQSDRNDVTSLRMFSRWSDSV